MDDVLVRLAERRWSVGLGFGCRRILWSLSDTATQRSQTAHVAPGESFRLQRGGEGYLRLRQNYVVTGVPPDPKSDVLVAAVVGMERVLAFSEGPLAGCFRPGCCRVASPRRWSPAL